MIYGAHYTSLVRSRDGSSRNLLQSQATRVIGSCIEYKLMVSSFLFNPNKGLLVCICITLLKCKKIVVLRSECYTLHSILIIVEEISNLGGFLVQKLSVTAGSKFGPFCACGCKMAVLAEILQLF